MATRTTRLPVVPTHAASCGCGAHEGGGGRKAVGVDAEIKDRNLKANPVVALSAQDPDNPYRYVQVRGRVTEMTEQGADAHIDALAKKYIGQDRYPHRAPGEVRVIVKIKPESVQGMG